MGSKHRQGLPELASTTRQGIWRDLKFMARQA